jgi:hypothetical protein
VIGGEALEARSHFRQQPLPRSRKAAVAMDAERYRCMGKAGLADSYRHHLAGAALAEDGKSRKHR